MGRPLRAVYANSTYSTGIQEMSDSDIGDLCTPLILSYIVNNPSTSYGTSLRVNSSGTYDVDRGTALDTRSSFVGDHPASNTTITSYTFYQNERTVSPLGVAARPVQYSLIGDEHRITEMTDSDIVDQIAPVVVQTMIGGGQGAYYLGLTSSGAPATGTWVSYATLNDTYYDVSNTLISDSHTLWQRSTGTSPGTIRPLKISGSSVVEMSNTDIESLAVVVGEYIRTAGIGLYALQPSAPGSGTWANRGTFTNKINNLSGVAYNGSFTGFYSQGYTGAYTGAYTTTYTGGYTAVYADSFTSEYTGAYSSAYTGEYTTAYTGAYVNVRGTPGSYGTVVSYGTTGTRNPVPTTTYYPVYYAPSYYTGYYSGTYSSTYTGIYAGAYTAVYGGSYTGAFTGIYTGVYNTTYTGVYAGVYTAAYTGAYTGAFTGLTVQSTTTSDSYTLWVRTA